MQKFGERDKSLSAIDGRYYKANLHAIVTGQALVFDSLRDIPHLIDEHKKLEEIIQELTAQNELLRKENEILKGGGDGTQSTELQPA